MSFATSSLIAALSGLLLAQDSGATLREAALRKAAVDAGLVRSHAVNAPFDPDLAEAGERLFRSKVLSLNGDTSCHSCHLEEFGSSDGIPLAVGVGGKGRGSARTRSGGQKIPRNTLPLWGRGGLGFTTFFWDGKVAVTQDEVISQFGIYVPSEDPLEVAVHLPIVELRELLSDDAESRELYQKENVAAAESILEEIAQRVAATPELGPSLSQAAGVPIASLRFRNVARALTHFMRRAFRLRPSTFERFVFDYQELTADQVAGGLVFYGKGRCSACHYGPYYSDLNFHALALPQRGFGKNGLGVDYGRFNVTFEPSDLYKMRTPPLLNVALTGPYGHSGSVETLDAVVRAHFDPLGSGEPLPANAGRRHSFYALLRAWSQTYPDHPPLSNRDVRSVVAFLKTLSFCDAQSAESDTYCRCATGSCPR